jgi:cytochrome c oxidase subunit 1
MAHAPEAHAEAHAHAEEAFIWKYVFSKNHRVIGIQYYVTAMVMALIAGLLAMLIRLQLAWPTRTGASWPRSSRWATTRAAASG